MIPAARGSVARASAFSSSVSTSVRRVRISSFSSPSNRLIVLSGASCGWSARMIGEESSRSERSAGPASTGQVCSLTQAAVAAAAHCGGSVRDRKVPGRDGEQRVRGDQRVAQQLLARRVRRAVAVVDHVEAQPVHQVGPGQVGRGDHDPAGDRPALAQQLPGRGAVRRAQLLDLAGRGKSDGHGLRAGEQLVQSQHRVQLPRHPLLEAQLPDPVDDQLVDRLPVGGVRGAGLQLQAAQPQLQLAAAGSGRLQQALGAVAGRLGAVAGRGEHAELPAQPVLLRRGAVGVEQVALEQHGVGDRGHRVQRPIVAGRRGHGLRPP